MARRQHRIVVRRGQHRLRTFKIMRAGFRSSVLQSTSRLAHMANFDGQPFVACTLRTCAWDRSPVVRHITECAVQHPTGGSVVAAPHTTPRVGVPKQKGHACLGSLRLEAFLDGDRCLSAARADARADASDDVDACWRSCDDGDRAGDRKGDLLPELRDDVIFWSERQVATRQAAVR